LKIVILEAAKGSRPPSQGLATIPDKTAARGHTVDLETNEPHFEAYFVRNNIKLMWDMF
jgi:hypothetical protein